MLKQLFVAGTVFACLAACEDRSTPTNTPRGGVTGNGTTTRPPSTTTTPGTTTPDRPSSPGATSPSSPGQTPGATSPSTPGGSGGQVDANFIKQAATIDQMEVHMGQLAADKAQNADVKAFGQKLVDDHGQSLEKLQQFAQKGNVQISTEMDQSGKQTHDRLAALSGQEFDRAFLQEMVTGHTQAIALYERQASQAQDQQVKDHCQQTLTVLRDHLKTAQDLQSRIGSGAGEGSDPTGR